jgi:hypothetical protein
MITVNGRKDGTLDAAPAFKKFSGIYIVAGEIRRVVYEAKDLEDARQHAAKWGVGIEGEAIAFPGDSPPPLPEAYDEKTARYLLGGISRTTLYAELATGRLQRLAGTRRVLVTRRSIERRCELN